MAKLIMYILFFGCSLHAMENNNEQPLLTVTVEKYTHKNDSYYVTCTRYISQSKEISYTIETFKKCPNDRRDELLRTHDTTLRHDGSIVCLNRTGEDFREVKLTQDDQCNCFMRWDKRWKTELYPALQEQANNNNH